MLSIYMSLASFLKCVIIFSISGNLTSLADNTQTEVARFGFSPSSVQQLGKHTYYFQLCWSVLKTFLVLV